MPSASTSGATPPLAADSRASFVPHRIEEAGSSDPRQAADGRPLNPQFFDLLEAGGTLLAITAPD
jgi:hypothetical protein